MNKNYLQIAIQKRMEIGGRLFCWHDWIYESIHLPSCVAEIISGKNANFLCTKCGKHKLGTFEAEITRYDERGNLVI